MKYILKNSYAFWNWWEYFGSIFCKKAESVFLWSRMRMMENRYYRWVFWRKSRILPYRKQNNIFFKRRLRKTSRWKDTAQISQKIGRKLQTCSNQIHVSLAKSTVSLLVCDECCIWKKTRCVHKTQKFEEDFSRYFRKKIMFLSILFIFGLLFGSFASVLITRLKSWKNGITTGRSMCPKCGHILSWKDLIPIFSWIFQKGKCRYCGAKIPVLYPLLELSMGIIFLLCGYFLIDGYLIVSGNIFAWIQMFVLLIFAFLSMVYVWYDILYLEIPEHVLLVLIGITFASLSIGIYFPQYMIFSHWWTIESLSNVSAISMIIFGILMIASLYSILWCEFSEWIDLGILTILWIGLYGIFSYFWPSIFFWSLLGAWGVFLFFFLQIFVSGGKWMWWWDLRIAILLWLVSGPFTVIGTVSAYIAGSVIGIITLIFLRLKWQKNLRNVSIPFGPFLATGIFCVLFFGETLHRVFFPFW